MFFVRYKAAPIIHYLTSTLLKFVSAEIDNREPVGIPRWYHFAVYSSSVGLSWFVNLPRLALLRIELRTLGLPVGCATIALIVDLYTVDSIAPGFLTRLICLVCEHCNLLGLDNSQFTDDRINAARRLKFIIYLWYSFFSLDYSNQPELSCFASWQVVDTPRVWSLG